MKIVFAFVGGCLDGKLFSGDTTDTTPEGLKNPAARFYLLTKCGEEGHRFSVPDCDGFDDYEVVKRLQNGNCIVVRASFIRCYSHPLTPGRFGGASF